LDNTWDVIGVAPGATLYCVKVLDSTGSGSDSTVMDGLDWVLSNHAGVTPPITVVNMSLGRPGSLDDNPPLRSLVCLLHDAGVAVVVAAKNDPFSEVSQHVPATYPEVIAVASTTAEAGSNQCRRVSFVAEADTASYFTTDGEFDDETNAEPGIGVLCRLPTRDWKTSTRAAA
jgi:subtilisin family serine protease